MIDYEVGEIPAVGLGVEVRDNRGNLINTVGYTSVAVEILGTDDERLDLNGVAVAAVPTAIGTYVIDWPKNRSLFNRRGRYLLRLVLRKPDGTTEYTRPEEIRVREFGRLN